jgi:hypothetical protein
MILNEETYKEYGYYPDDLSPLSGRNIIIQCDNCKKRQSMSKSNAVNKTTGLCRSCRILQRNNFDRQTYMNIAKSLLMDPDIHYATLARQNNISPYNIHRLLRGKLFNEILKEMKNDDRKEEA